MSDPLDPTPDEVLESFYGSQVDSAPNAAGWNTTLDAEAPPPAPNPAQWDQFVEGDIERPVDPVSALPAAPPLSTSAGASRSVSSGSSSSQGYKGVPQAKQDSLLARYDAQNAEAEDEANKNATAEAAAIEGRRASEKKLIEDRARDEREHQKNLLRLADEKRDFLETEADLELKIRDQEIVDRETIIGEYKQQLAGVRSLAAQSGNPLGGLSGGEALGLGAAGFAQGFLAAQGIQINVTGQIDKFVDREIAVHQQKIENAKEDAAATMHLYNVARQSSEDDWEARERYRGFVMEGMKSQIQVEAARFGTQLATQAGVERSAELDAHLNTLIAGIGTAKAGRIAAARKANLAETVAFGHIQQEQRNSRIAQQNANTGSFNARTQRMAEERAEKERKAKADESKPRLLIPNSGATKRDPKTGKVIGVMQTHAVREGLSDGITKEAYTKAAELSQAYGTGIAALDEIAKLRKPAFPSGLSGIPLMHWKRTNEGYRKYERAVIMQRERLIKALTGAAAPTDQMNRIMSVTGDDSIFQAGDNSEAIVQLKEDLQKQLVGRLDTDPALEPVPPDQQEMRPIYDTPNDTSAQYNAEMHAKKGLPGPVGEAAKTITSTDGSRNEVKLGGGYSPAYFEFMKKTGDTRGAGKTSNREKTPGQRQEIDGVDHLAALYLKPHLGNDTVGGQSTTSPDDLAAMKALTLETIKKLADGKEIAPGQDADPEVRDYARVVYRELSDPWNDTKTAEAVEALYDRYTRRAHEAGEDEKPASLSPYGETDVPMPGRWGNQ